MIGMQMSGLRTMYQNVFLRTTRFVSSSVSCSRKYKDSMALSSCPPCSDVVISLDPEHAYLTFIQLIASVHHRRQETGVILGFYHDSTA